ncbi:ejaculatory bulb-specific protein 3 [Metopolophium dirhodum]|uniref:ejaculatory bulb-specific protein 3 n=1 Tax=Metopolophium dirhodum TaxID=44670 RepID=UPI0029901AAD|nr:ejaculatory bulb-specific protein 3 [Metopolophium dirhodum]
MAHLNLFVVLVASLVCFTLAEEKYTTKFDNFDVDKVLNNDRILTSYIKCLLDQGNCTNEGRELKRVLPDALKTDCSKCTTVQKDRSEKVIKFLIKNRSTDFDHLTAKYDPSGEYKKKIEKFDAEKAAAAKH